MRCRKSRNDSLLPFSSVGKQAVFLPLRPRIYPLNTAGNLFWTCSEFSFGNVCDVRLRRDCSARDGSMCRLLPHHRNRRSIRSHGHLCSKRNRRASEVPFPHSPQSCRPPDIMLSALPHSRFLCHGGRRQGRQKSRQPAGRKPRRSDIFLLLQQT